MADDDVQFLGMRPAALLDALPITASGNRPVTGIALHVESSEREPASRMLFMRTNTTEVEIGRRHSDDTDTSDDSKALFGCPVVSRKHAVLIFSEDTGSACIMDKGSHHGTYMRRRGESGLARRLVPEQSVLLRDGDQITLGKVVGRSAQDMVAPVVFRVELLHGTIDSTAGPESSVASNTGTPPKHVSSSAPPRRPSGCFSARDLSDDEQDMPEAEHPACGPFRSMEDFVAEHNRRESLFAAVAAANDSVSDSARSAPMDLSSPSPRSASPEFHRPKPDGEASMSQEIVQRQRVDTQTSWPDISLHFTPPSGDAHLEDLDEDEQTSDSLMEDSAPLHTAIHDDGSLESRIEKLQTEINRLQTHRRKIKSTFNANTHAITRRFAGLDEWTSSVEEQHEQMENRVGVVEERCGDALARVEVSSGHINRLNERADGMDERMDGVDQRLGRLNGLSTSLEDRLEDDSDRITGAHDRITELGQEIMEVDGRQEDLQAQYDALKERQGQAREETGELRDEVKDLRHRAVLAEEAHAALQREHEKLQSFVRSLQQKHLVLDGDVSRVSDESHNDARVNVQDLDARVAALSARVEASTSMHDQRAFLEGLIDEVKSIRATAKQSAEAEATRVRDEACRIALESERVHAAIAEFKRLQAQARADRSHNQGPGPLSSKRKRHDEDGGIDEEGEMPAGSQASLSLMSDASDVDLAPLTEDRTLDRVGRPRAKRARQVGRTLARTAATATVGAALTWTALAYI
ncbi:hypothetical protein HDZ31DRAFT_83597 [Schizophyllum fasciatum]